MLGWRSRGLLPSTASGTFVPLGAVLGALAMIGSLGLGPVSPAGANQPTTYYLAVGASESVGVQPTPAHPHGQPTDQGYADDLVVAERARWPGLELVKVGCPGETAKNTVDGGGRCPYPDGSQLATAVAFLRAHTPATVLVTVDLGFNDLRPCLAHHTVDQPCIVSALAQIRQDLPGALAQLQEAGGSSLHIVGLEHDDPYLGDFVDGSTGQAFAAATLPVFDQLNGTLGAIYTAAGIPIANVAHAFDTQDQRPTALSGYGAVPENVAKVCTLTWMCPGSPYAHNLHPNAEGYQVIAGAVAAALGDSTAPAAPGGTA